MTASTRVLTLLAALLALAPVSALPAGSAQGQPVGQPFSAQAMAERFAQTLPTGRSSAAVAEPPERPAESAGPPMAWDDLRRSLDAMGRWLAACESRPQRKLNFARLARVAQSAGETSHTRTVQVQTDFAAGLQMLAQAVQHMTAARDTVRAPSAEAAWAAEVLGELTAVGARLAADGLQRARAGGVDNQRMAAAAHAYQNGLALMQRGDHVQAFGQFAPSITVGNLPVFNLDRFERNLNDAFGTQTVGYQYAIARDGVLASASVYGTTGLARTNANPPNTSQVATKETNIASISETITAMVLLKLLEERNVSVDSPIAQWLPADWALGPGIRLDSNEPLSFRELLTHRSGLNANRNTAYRYADLQGYAAAGIVPADKVWTYQNANFAMFRVVIPYLRYGANGVNGISALVPFAPFEEVIAGLYIETVRGYAF